jgi:hypothetical protein
MILLNLFYYTRSDATAILTQPVFIEKMTAQFRIAGEQHRDPVAETCCELRVVIDIQHGELEVQHRLQARERLQHIGAQVTTVSTVDRQPAGYRCHARHPVNRPPVPA